MSSNSWINHIKQVQNEKGISWKEAMILAKKSYKKKNKKQSGTGAVKDFVLQKLRSRPPILNAIMKNNKKVVKIEVCRKPITKTYRKFLKFVTGGDSEKTTRKYSYDDIYHLFMILIFEDGSRMSLEKNQRVKIRKPKPKSKQTECKTVSIGGIPFGQMMMKAEERGGKDFYRYSAYRFNCQHFLNTILTANGINSLSSFILQDARSLLPKGIGRSAIQSVTDAAGFIDALTGGSKF